MGLDELRDIQSRDLLSSLLGSGRDLEKEISKFDSMVGGKQVVMFGAGPSLSYDIEGLSNFLQKDRPTIIAADGAADGLWNKSISPDLVVSDLDSCSRENLEKASQEKVLFVHSHGDNMSLVKELVPSLGANIVGTTQVEPIGIVKNFGGFTDGDRACYIACTFEPSQLVIAGMDFGAAEGSFSVNRYDRTRSRNREKKLEWGRKSLEYLISLCSSRIEFVNVTKFGADIAGAKKVSYESLTSEDGQPFRQ